MRTKNFDIIKKELMYFGILFLSAVIVFKAIYFREDFLVVLRMVASLFWLFALPGYFMTFYWAEKLDFTERFIAGFALAAGIIGIFSYYIGLMELNIKYHTILLPLSIIITGFIIAFLKKENRMGKN